MPWPQQSPAVTCSLSAVHRWEKNCRKKNANQEAVLDLVGSAWRSPCCASILPASGSKIPTFQATAASHWRTWACGNHDILYNIIIFIWKKQLKARPCWSQFFKTRHFLLLSVWCLPRFLPLSCVLAHGFWWAAPGTRPAKCFGFQNEMSKWMRYLNLQHPPTRKKKTKSWLGARTRTSVRVLWALPNPWIFSACAIANSSWVRSPWSHCSCTDAGTCILPALVLPHSLFNRIYNACWLNSCRRKNS